MNTLLNINEAIPDKLFIFVNEMNPLTDMNFNITGKFSSGAFSSLGNSDFMKKYLEGSVKYLPYSPCHMDCITLSPYFLTAINDYRIEYDAEYYRENNHPLYPSRLSAVYAFGSYDECIKVNQKHRWPLDTVKEFKLLEHPLNRVVKVNMEHVSLARHAYKVSSLQDIDRLWAGYWAGFDNIILELPSQGFQRREYDSGIIWEYLIEGVVEKI